MLLFGLYILIVLVITSVLIALGVGVGAILHWLLPALECLKTFVSLRLCGFVDQKPICSRARRLACSGGSAANAWSKGSGVTGPS